MQMKFGKSTLSVHNEKFSRNGSGKGKNKKPPMNGMLVHIERDEEKYKDVKHSNPYIDDSRTQDNIVLHREPGSFVDRYERVISEKYTGGGQRGAFKADGSPSIRADAVTMIHTTINFGGTVQDASIEEQNQMLMEFYNDYFVKNHEDVISAVIHNDETNPHLHICWVPMTRDGRLCASQVNGRNALQRLQNESLEFMKNRFPTHGFHRLTDEEKLMNGMSPEAHTVWKKLHEEFNENYEKLNTSYEELLVRAEELDKKESELEQRSNELDEREFALESDKNEVLATLDVIGDVKQQQYKREKKLSEREEKLIGAENALKAKKYTLDKTERELANRYHMLSQKETGFENETQHIVSELNKREKAVHDQEEQLSKREQELAQRESALVEFQRRGNEVMNNLLETWKSITDVSIRNRLKKRVDPFLPIESTEDVEHLELTLEDFNGLTETPQL